MGCYECAWTVEEYAALIERFPGRARFVSDAKSKKLPWIVKRHDVEEAAECLLVAGHGTGVIAGGSDYMTSQRHLLASCIAFMNDYYVASGQFDTARREYGMDDLAEIIGWASEPGGIKAAGKSKYECLLREIGSGFEYVKMPLLRGGCISAKWDFVCRTSDKKHAIVRMPTRLVRRSDGGRPGNKFEIDGTGFAVQEDVALLEYQLFVDSCPAGCKTRAINSTQRVLKLRGIEAPSGPSGELEYRLRTDALNGLMAAALETSVEDERTSSTLRGIYSSLLDTHLDRIAS